MISTELLKEKLEQFIEERMKAGNPVDRNVQELLRKDIYNLTPLQLQALSIGDCNKLLECGYFCGHKKSSQCETSKEYKRLVFKALREQKN